MATTYACETCKCIEVLYGTCRCGAVLAPNYTEIAYHTYDKHGRQRPAKRVVVKDSKVEAKVADLESKGYTIYGTRKAEGGAK